MTDRMSDPVADDERVKDSLGAELRKQREIRGITLKEIADATKISKRYLEALEQDNYSTLPAPVFTRGFVREYARYMGLNSEEMASRYADVVRRTEQAEIDSQEIPRIHTKPRSMPFVRIDRNVIWFAALAVVFSGVMWWVGRYMGEHNQRQVVPAQTTTVEPAVAPSVQSDGVVSSTAPAASPDRLELKLRTTDDTWVILLVDGRPTVNEVLRAGDERTLQAENEFRFQVVGNAGGLELTLNGRKVPALGPKGRVVRDQVFDWDSLKRLEGATKP